MAATKTKTRKPRRDVEAEVTDRVIAALESGTVPWQKPWTAAGILPTSMASGKPYRGINVWLLSMTAMSEGYSSPYWLTFNQAKDLGGSVRKGEKGTQIVFWRLLDVERDNPLTGDKDKVKIPLMRLYTVFNLEQTDDVKVAPRFQIDESEDGEGFDPSVLLDGILEGYVDGPQVKHATGDAAFYDPKSDRVTLPEPKQFDGLDGYAATLLHELAHSTGHESRLDRFGKTGEPQHFGTARYAEEELLAQMGAAMLAAIVGTDPQIENSAAYIKNWLSALSDDKSLVIKAAQKAQKAVDRILGTTFETKEETA